MRTYVVQKGDTLWLIAKRYGISLDSLIAANPQISDPDRIDVGWVINIPVGGQQTPTMSPCGPMNYTVMPGDTLWLISKKFGIPLEDIIKANPQIPDPNRIDIGQIIIIPAKVNCPTMPPMPPMPSIPPTMPPYCPLQPHPMPTMCPTHPTHPMYPMPTMPPMMPPCDVVIHHMHHICGCCKPNEMMSMMPGMGAQMQQMKPMEMEGMKEMMPMHHQMGCMPQMMHMHMNMNTCKPEIEEDDCKKKHHKDKEKHHHKD